MIDAVVSDVRANNLATYNAGLAIGYDVADVGGIIDVHYTVTQA